MESLPNYPVEAAAATSTCVVSIDRHNARVVTIDNVRRLALSLPRTYERLIGDSVRFKVGQLVYASISADETLMGFGFPREERTALIAVEIGRAHV